MRERRKKIKKRKKEKENSPSSKWLSLSIWDQHNWKTFSRQCFHSPSLCLQNSVHWFLLFLAHLIIPTNGWLNKTLEQLFSNLSEQLLKKGITPLAASWTSTVTAWLQCSQQLLLLQNTAGVPNTCNSASVITNHVHINQGAPGAPFWHSLSRGIKQDVWHLKFKCSSM